MTTFKVFKKKVIIAIEEEIATALAKVSRKSGAAGFDKEEKYVQADSDLAFVFEREKK